jgi:hypothetical protein
MAHRKRRSDRRKDARRPDERPSRLGFQGVVWAIGGGVLLLVLLFVFLLLLGARPLSAQGLAEFDYENLALRGVMVEAGGVFPDRVDASRSFGLRADLGFLGPGVRVTAGVSRWSSSLGAGEVRALEERIEDLMEVPEEARPSLDLAPISLSDVALSGDVHFMWRVPFGVLTYVGGGATAHVFRGGGAAIEDTLLQDLLSTVRAGANLHAGMEVVLTRQMRLVGEARYELVQDFSYAHLRAGVQVLWGGWVPGED